MSKPWGAVGAWALEAERAEAEEREAAAAAAALAAAAPADLFPSLKDAAATKPKKKKPVTIPLSEFAAATSRMGPTYDDILRLPTGPKERSAEELESSRFGRGFNSSYGSGSASGPGSGPRRSYGAGFDDDNRRGPPPPRDMDLPSRADEVDNWASAKKAFVSDSGPGRHDRYGSLGGGSPSKADEVDSWFAGKKTAPPVSSRNSSFGSGFREPFGGGGGLSDSDRWARGGGGGGGGLLPASNNGERRRLVLDAPKTGPVVVSNEQARNKPSPFGAARPREEVLAEKGVDWRKVESDIENKKSTSRPTSSQSSRPTSSQSNRPESPADGAVRARPKVNPFGNAKPREVLLEEKGKDWRKIDMELEHRSVDRTETDEEKILKEEIERLKNDLTKETKGDLDGDSTEQASSLHDLIAQKEKDLEKLTRDLDDKVKFGQKAIGEIRPGSGAGRIIDRVPSQPGIFEEPRIMEFADRPRSRGGMGDSWGKPMDDRRGPHGGRESGFFGGRHNDRSRREGW